MAECVELKDKRLLIILSLKDALEAVGEYAGEELERYLTEYYECNIADVEDYEKEYDRMEREMDRQREGIHNALMNLLEETEQLSVLLTEKRLDRRRIEKAVSNLSRHIRSEL